VEATVKKLFLVPLLLAAAVAALVVPGGTVAGAAASGCGVTWGSLPKTSAPLSVSPVANVRAGQHPCFDRIVVDIAGPAGGYNVRYVPQVVQDGSGLPVPLAGGAFIQLTVHDPAYDANGNPTYTPRDPRHVVNVNGYRTFRQAAWAGSFEGYSTIGLGVRARLPFRVFALAGPGANSRLVVDVAHSWT
jgi:hypothetical protein